MIDADGEIIDSPITAGRPDWRSKLQDAGDRLLGALLGIDTARSVDHVGLGIDASAGSPYQPTNWINLANLYRVLRQMHVGKENVFADFGCGKGIVLLLAGLFEFGTVIGIDLSEAMIGVAALNIARRTTSATRDRYELVHVDATAYQIPPGLDTCYFYRPFPSDVYDIVVGNLAASTIAHPREIRLIYLHPRPEDVSIMARHGFHEKRRLRDLVLYSNAVPA